MFSETKITTLANSILSSANVFNLYHSDIFSLGKRLIQRTKNSLNLQYEAKERCKRGYLILQLIAKCYTTGVDLNSQYKSSNYCFFIGSVFNEHLNQILQSSNLIPAYLFVQRHAICFLRAIYSSSKYSKPKQTIYLHYKDDTDIFSSNMVSRFYFIDRFIEY